MLSMDNMASLTPAELAADYAERLIEKGILDGYEASAGLPTVRHLDSLASSEPHEFPGKRYYVKSRRSLLLPEGVTSGIAVTGINFFDLKFAGDFQEYGLVRIDNRLGKYAMQALCLRFENITLLPGFERIETGTLHVPALAVKDMDELAA